jgi:transcription termination factor NusB
VPADPDVKDYATSLVQILSQHQPEIDVAISRIAKNWSLSRMAATDRSVIRLAAGSFCTMRRCPCG